LLGGQQNGGAVNSDFIICNSVDFGIGSNSTG
jgi:hypothetical protein